MKDRKPFTEYDIYDLNSKIDSKIKKRVMTQTMPLKLVKYTFGVLFILFVSPILFLFSYDMNYEPILMSSILLSECFVFLIFSALAGIVLSISKNPKLQEIKNFFGYVD